MSQIKVIYGQNVVYTTQYKTIVFKQSFSNYDEEQAAKNQAKISAFNYALYETKAVCDLIDNIELSTDGAVFAYLEKCHSPK